MSYELPKRLLCGKCGMSFPIRENHRGKAIAGYGKSKARCSEPGCGRPHYDGILDDGVVNVFMTPSQAREWLDSR